MIFKSGVLVKDIKPALIMGLLVAEKVYENYNIELVITSVNDSIHKIGSLHYKGFAADLRIGFVNNEEVNRVAKIIKTNLTNEYDIVVENDHIHLEYDPK